MEREIYIIGMSQYQNNYIMNKLNEYRNIIKNILTEYAGFSCAL